MTSDDPSYKFKSRAFDERKADSERILKKYPNRVPIILSRRSRTEVLVDKYKYLSPGDVTVMSLLYHIRKNIKLRPEQAIYLMINEEMCNTTLTMDAIYETKKDADGFLYITYSNENTFGSN
jgi:GABA(A) receptor-associated protein